MGRGEHFGRGFGGGRHGWGRHGHGGGRRMFEQGDLRYLILSLIAEKSSYGYELIKTIEERTGGAYAPSPGVVYPLLTLLEELGLVTLTAEDGGKKLYAITDDGRAELEKNKETLEHINAHVEGVRARSVGGRSPQIMRAIQNFRTALHLRMERGPLTDEQAQTIAAAIDAAAQTIERT
ncbi:MAG: PadR family transcriptional regulator [Proteobacteria bacterium]|nr:PadR family transcriptional regulator [Pseudomonadota bacterium]